MHEVRLLWANHVTHHSSERYNLSTALRQPWSGFLMSWVFLPMPWLGIPAHHVAKAGQLNLLYQYWIHTEAIDRLPKPVEAVFNTPSHHRVHHGANPQYLDKNYGGILIVWDRLFGTFEPEVRRVKYGLTKNIHTYNPIRIGYHEFVDIARDVRCAADGAIGSAMCSAAPAGNPPTEPDPPQPTFRADSGGPVHPKCNANGESGARTGVRRRTGRGSAQGSGPIDRPGRSSA